MSDGCDLTDHRLALDLARQQCRLIEGITRLSGAFTILPPPTMIRIHWVKTRAGSLLAASLGSATSGRDEPGSEVVGVTQCLSGGARIDLGAVDLAAFRRWSMDQPEHPLAIRYQPLCAWLMAARCDPRFLQLARAFIHGERLKLRSEILRATQRLLSARNRGADPVVLRRA